MQETIVRCDICGIRRMDSNHWFQVLTTNDTCQILNYNNHDARAKDACGQSCAIAIVQQWMDRKLPEPITPEMPVPIPYIHHSGIMFPKEEDCPF